MAFLKFSRDKRGYEHFYLLEPARAKARTRLLYWFRTPPNVKVGRTPFDLDMRQALEIQNPDVAFDWEAIGRTPIPPPAETERWRERRRADRAMKSAEAAALEEEASQSAEPEPTPSIPLDVVIAAEPSPHPELPPEAGNGEDVESAGDLEERGAEAAAASATSNGVPIAGVVPAGGAGHRRRRRRRRGPKPQDQGGV